MENKTKVRLRTTPHQSMLKGGDIGYIDGYVRAGDNRGYAVVVVEDRLDFVSFNQLEVLKD